MQHMRTHDDWPDDEAAAQLLADAEKKTGKKVAVAGLPTDKEFNPFGPMMPFPWQMPPAFLKWAQQTGINPFIPFIPPPLPPGASPKDMLADGMDIDAGLILPDSAAVMDAQQLMEATNANTVSAESQSMSPPPKNAEESSTIPPDLMTVPLGAIEDPPQEKGKKSSKAKSRPKPVRGASKSTVGSTSVPTSPTDGAAETSMDLSMPPGMMNSMMPGMNPWGMPPGMQFPFMPMPPPMAPPGMPFPPPAIAIPIPIGTPLPHPSQLPPNAQLIPDPKGGHTIIIPPPPSPWGMPFPPGMMPMSMLPGPIMSPALDSSVGKAPPA